MIGQLMFSVLALGAMMALIGSSVERLVPRTLLSRRWIWLATMTVSVMLPAAMAARPRPAVFAHTPAVTTAPVVSAVASDSPSAPIDLDALLLFVWSAFSAALSLGFIAIHQRTLAQMASWRVCDLGGEEIIISPDFGPAAVGLRRARVVIPEWVLALSSEEQSLILMHERQHVAARDHWLLLAAVGMMVMLPWNPALWWQFRRLRVAIELDCDARVAPTPRERPRYTTLLLNVRHRQQGYRGALAFFPTSSALAERVFALLDPSSPSRARRSVWLAAAIMAAGAISRIPVPRMLNAAAPPTPTARVSSLGDDTVESTRPNAADSLGEIAGARRVALAAPVGSRPDAPVTARSPEMDSVSAFIAAGGYARLIPIDSLPAITAAATQSNSGLTARAGRAWRIATPDTGSQPASGPSVGRMYRIPLDTASSPTTARAVPRRAVVPPARPDSG
jgi:beta-lactamase regulating signal transducer with metallopeptidase domain